MTDATNPSTTSSMPCSRSDLRLGVAAVALLCVLQLPNQVLAHAAKSQTFTRRLRNIQYLYAS